MRRRIQGPDRLDLSDKDDLKCWISNELPDHVKADVRGLMGGNPTEREIQEFLDSGALGGRYAQCHRYDDYDDYDVENHYNDIW